MVSDWELWACAHKVVSDYGWNAAAHAQACAEELARKGDPAGEALWYDILARISVLQAARPASVPLN